MDHKASSHCSGIFGRIYGLPCSHIVASSRQSRTPLPLSSFHPVWHLEPPSTSPGTHLLDQPAAPASLNSSSLIEAISSQFHTWTEQKQAAVWSAIESSTPLFNPLPIQTRGRPAKSSNSLKRDLSSFELAEKAAKRAKNQCRRCGALGHNRRTCTSQIPDSHHSA